MSYRHGWKKYSAHKLVNKGMIKKAILRFFEKAGVVRTPMNLNDRQGALHKAWGHVFTNHLEGRLYRVWGL